MYIQPRHEPGSSCDWGAVAIKIYCPSELLPLDEDREAIVLLTKIIVKTSFDALHCWGDCPHDIVRFLRTTHRHKFFVRVSFITTSDRAVEFFIAKSAVDAQIARMLSKFVTAVGLPSLPYSCERMAEEIGLSLQQCSYVVDAVEVWEDDENGARVEFLV